VPRRGRWCLHVGCQGRRFWRFRDSVRCRCGATYHNSHKPRRLVVVRGRGRIWCRARVYGFVMSSPCGKARPGNTRRARVRWAKTREPPHRCESRLRPLPTASPTTIAHHVLSVDHLFRGARYGYPDAPHLGSQQRRLPRQSAKLCQARHTPALERPHVWGRVRCTIPWKDRPS
jgi:hypothetical protein